MQVRTTPASWGGAAELKTALIQYRGAASALLRPGTAWVLISDELWRDLNKTLSERALRLRGKRILAKREAAACAAAAASRGA